MYTAPAVVQPPEIAKDSSLCELPGCPRRKYVEGSTVHNFCGKRHAAEAKKRGIATKQGKTIIMQVQYVFAWSLSFMYSR